MPNPSVIEVIISKLYFFFSSELKHKIPSFIHPKIKSPEAFCKDNWLN